MATKMISLDLEAYEKLCSARRDEKESFSEVIKRAKWGKAKKGTAGPLLALADEWGTADAETMERWEKMLAAKASRVTEIEMGADTTLAIKDPII